MGESKRLLFFDIIRVCAILLVLLWHLGSYLQISFIMNMLLGIPNVYYVYIGGIGVSLFIFISGSMLEYTYTPIKNMKGLFNFYRHRFTKIIPAYTLVWLIALTTIIFTSLNSLSYYDITTWVLDYTGLMYLRMIPDVILPNILPLGWFIGLLSILYLIFPFLSNGIKKYPYISISALFIISYGLAYYFNTNNWYSWSYVFPACRLFEFGLGIFIVQKGLYPKVTYNNANLKNLVDNIFYIYLVHQILLNLTKINIILWIIVVWYFARFVSIIDNKMQSYLWKTQTKKDQNFHHKVVDIFKCGMNKEKEDVEDLKESVSQVEKTS